MTLSSLNNWQRAGLAIAAALLVFLLWAWQSRWWFFPTAPFDAAAAPPAPDYRDEANWAALPQRVDGADVVPPDSGAVDRQREALVDVFFIYPTTYLLGGDWNAAVDNRLANRIADSGVLPQQASAFNGVARVYAPRYRQASLGAQVQSEREGDKQQALMLALSDVVRAFDHYMAHDNEGRPFIIAGHSQGTMLGAELVKHLFNHYPQAVDRFIAAYLIGNAVGERQLSPTLDVCAEPAQTGCYLGWNAVLEGGEGGDHWRGEGDTVCVNPLSWRFDEEPVAASENLGAIPLVSLNGLARPAPQLTGARCDKGILRISRPAAEGYSLGLFPGGSYHTYDYNLFYMNIRANAEARVRAFLQRRDGA